MGKILITSTSDIKGTEIIEYYGIITVNFVTGANFISDYLAKWTDFLGGISNSYTDELDILTNKAMESLKIKCKNKGMNAILGLDILINPVFGSDYSMFMVSATGTAVKIVKEGEGSCIEDNLLSEIKANIRLMESDKILNSDNIKVFEDMSIDNIEEIILGIDPKDSMFFIKLLLNSSDSIQIPTMKTKCKLNVIKEYLSNLDKELFSGLLYENITKEKYIVAKSIGIVDYKTLKNELIRDINNQWALKCISITPEYISENDFVHIKELQKYLSTKFNIKVEEKKYGIMKKDIGWICKNCRATVPSLNDKACYSCKHDKYGLPFNLNYGLGMSILNSILKVGLKNKIIN